MFWIFALIGQTVANNFSAGLLLICFSFKQDCVAGEQQHSPRTYSALVWSSPILLKPEHQIWSCAAWGQKQVFVHAHLGVSSCSPLKRASQDAVITHKISYTPVPKVNREGKHDTVSACLTLGSHPLVRHQQVVPLFLHLTTRAMEKGTTRARVKRFNPEIFSYS